MNLSDADIILDKNICGYHQYVLGKNNHLSFASQNLCDMTGYSKDELLSDNEDLYSLLIHPNDRKIHKDFLNDLLKKEQTLTVEYHIIKKDGTSIFVKDTSQSIKNADATMIAYSVLCDITDLRDENQNLRFLNETAPCGFLKYTCEKQPRLTYINKQMLDFLRIPKEDGDPDLPEMYKENLFLLIPMEERRRFSLYLNRVYSSDIPLAGEMSINRFDGTKAHVFGWVTKHINEKGEEEFQSVCMDVTSRHNAREAAENERYVKALTEVYDKIFEFNLTDSTIKCIYCEDSSMFKRFENIPMQANDALEKWIMDSVDEADYEKVRRFFIDFCLGRSDKTESIPPQISYSALSSEKKLKRYSGIFIKISESTGFYCCRKIHEYKEVDVLKIENTQLRENMNELVMRFCDGTAAFELTPDDCIKPLFASENVCEFFGYTSSEWIPLTQKYTPWKTFVQKSEANYAEFEKFLKNGEAEFTFFDYKCEKERKIKAICTQKRSSKTSPRYVVLYLLDDDVKEGSSIPANPKVSIRTFGYFDVFVNDKPIPFRNKKSKELLAILIDRRGGFVTSEEAIGFLWEDEPSNSVTFSRYRKVALRLKNTLEEYNISNILETVDGKRRVVPETFNCDLYDYLTGKEEYNSLFKGSYLSNYSWGETTLGELTDIY